MLVLPCNWVLINFMRALCLCEKSHSMIVGFGSYHKMKH